MKLRVFIFIGILAGIGFFYFGKEKQSQHLSSVTHTSDHPSLTPDPTRPSVNYQALSYVFVPYWSFAQRPIVQKNNETFVYFAVTGDMNGIDTTDSGYKKIPSFNRLSPPAARKLLAVQMIDATTNFSVLRDTNAQEKIIDQSIQTAQDNGFNGIVLDFESSSLSFAAVKDRISNFVKTFYARTKTVGLEFDLTIYGDAFFRFRPYDVPLLAQNSDTLFVMAYDFTKARDNPGPNFPLNGADTYGYDFKHMAQDFAKLVPSQKLAVIFGMFGYDWIVDNQGRSTDTGDSLSDLQIQNKFLASCAYQNCSITHDTQSAETKVNYTDGSDHHVVWFEDTSSSNKKIQYLNSLGIKSTGYWAYSYY